MSFKILVYKTSFRNQILIETEDDFHHVSLGVRIILYQT